MTSQLLPPAVDWVEGSIEVVDQRLLPDELRLLRLSSVAEAVEAIATLAVRGAPAIGICAAFAMVLGLDEARRPGETAKAREGTVTSTAEVLDSVARRLSAARPTAVNLSWAVEKVRAAASTGSSLTEARQRALSEAVAIAEQDKASSERIGELGAEALRGASSILTHCNTGRLVSAGWGTALAAVYAKARAGEAVRVYACEARPLLQGARLTMWELLRAGVAATLVVDAAAATLMQRRLVDAVIVGADRIACNGDTANKVGTLSLAALAAHFGVPFWVAAPLSTLDFACSSGESIVVEQRSAGEVLAFRGQACAPPGADAWNPAFDVTPGELVTGFVTEVGILTPPFDEALAR